MEIYRKKRGKTETGLSRPAATLLTCCQALSKCAGNEVSVSLPLYQCSLVSCSVGDGRHALLTMQKYYFFLNLQNKFCDLQNL